MESDKLPKVTTKDEEKVIEAKVVEVLESVSLINTKRPTSGVDQSGTSREPSPPGPPIYRYPAINTRHISRVYFTNKKSCSFVGVETNLPPIHINGNEFAFPDHHQYQKVRNPPDRLALPVLINNLGKKQKLLILKHSR